MKTYLSVKPSITISARRWAVCDYSNSDLLVIHERPLSLGNSVRSSPNLSLFLKRFVYDNIIELVPYACTIRHLYYFIWSTCNISYDTQNDIWWVSSGFCQKVPGGGLRYFLQITSPGRYAILTLIDFRYWNSHIYIVSSSPILLSIITRLLVSLVCRNEEKSNTCLYFFEEICV